MKDSEFIQLLNLYLDHEIAAADAARLEAEVQGNPDRQKIYRQYCRMQKACKLLTTDFRPELAPTHRRDRTVISFGEQLAAGAPRQVRAGRPYAIGGFAAAAACVAIIFVGRGRQVPPESPGFAQTPAPQIAPAVLVAATPTASPVVPDPSSVNSDASPTMVVRSVSGPRALGVGNRSALVADLLLLTGNTQADAMLAAAIEQANTQFAWMHHVQLPPIERPASQNNLRFEMQPTSLRPDARTMGNRSTQPATEMAAFQFSK